MCVYMCVQRPEAALGFVLQQGSKSSFEAGSLLGLEPCD